MDQRNFHYSMESIDVASKKLYLKILIDKLKLLINGNGNGNRKHYFVENGTGSTFNYGFKTRKYPSQHKVLMEFEDDLQNIISNVQFRRVNNDF